MKLISRKELIERLYNQTTQTIVSMVCVTEPDMRAKAIIEAVDIAVPQPNPYRSGKGKAAVSTISKVLKVNGKINDRYERVVTNKAKRMIIAEREAANLAPLSPEQLDAAAAAVPDFGESWHTPILDAEGKPTCLSVNRKTPENGKVYIRFIFKAKREAQYVNNDNGATEPSENVYPFLSPSSDYSNQNLAEGDEVRFVVYDVANIAEIALGGERLRILDTLAEQSEGMRNKVWAIAEEYLEGERSMSKVGN